MDEKKVIQHTPLDPDAMFAELEEKIRSLEAIWTSSAFARPT